MQVDYTDDESGEAKQFDQHLQIKMFSAYSRQSPAQMELDVKNQLYLLMLEHIELVTDQKDLFLETHTELKDCDRTDTDLF